MFVVGDTCVTSKVPVTFGAGVANKTGCARGAVSRYTSDHKRA